MLHRVGPWRHVVVGVSVAGVAALAGFGVIGAGDDGLFRDEHFDSKQVTVWPEGADGVRIREVVDIDFGIEERRGYQRFVPNDFGEPTDVTASTPDANGELNVVGFSRETRIRIGDPNITWTGQHRYFLEYTLPDAQLGTGELNLDIIGTDETNRTDRFEVVLTGFEFDGTRCDTGEFGEFGGCEFERDAAGRYVAVIEPLEPGEGITVGGTIVSTGAADLPGIPALPDRVASGWRPLGFVMLIVGLGVTLGVYSLCRRYGSNEVVAGGAADAAFGRLPAPQRGEPVADVPTYRVPDARLGELATIEFVPPRGIEPWQGRVVLTEELDDSTVSAWFSEMVAREAIVLRENGERLEMEPGPNTARLSAVDHAHLARLFEDDDRIKLGTYNESFTDTWKRIRGEQKKFIDYSGWWKRGGPSGSSIDVGQLAVLIPPAVVLFVFIGSSGAARAVAEALANPFAAIAAGALFLALVAYLAYRVLLPARTATGSALALRTESFRRFLVASEGSHVEWAWKHGLLREYSAWAVALDAADAWERAVESSNIPHRELALSGPLLIHSYGSSFRSTYTKPSSSGGGSGGFSGGGFSGGVGGGGGGGSSGSW